MANQSNQPSKRIIAQLLRCKVDEIDSASLFAACGHVNRKDEDYWDAMANAGQLDGNPPYQVCVALVYRFNH